MTAPYSPEVRAKLAEWATGVGSFSPSPQDVAAALTHIETLEGALQRISYGTTDLSPPFRALGVAEMRTLAARALNGADNDQAG